MESEDIIELRKEIKYAKQNTGYLLILVKELCAKQGIDPEARISKYFAEQEYLKKK